MIKPIETINLEGYLKMQLKLYSVLKEMLECLYIAVSHCPVRPTRCSKVKPSRITVQNILFMILFCKASYLRV
jgi:hypothetical protein